MKLADRDIQAAYVARHRRPWRVQVLWAKWHAVASAWLKEGTSP